ncbi:MAG: hypothetical protein AMS18_07985 [Gemmatimonas sp. SG8_17]|nr:MAG: hypothetical protein AMS18_07985 [Gemmatimonas sp. SG8_17]
MRFDFAVVCDYALIDQYGKLSVLGIFQHIWVSQFPTVHPRLHLVMRLKGSRTEVGQHQVQIRLTNAEGKEIIKGDGTVTFAEPPAGVLEVEAGAVLLFDVPFESAGRYQFEIEVDQGMKTEVPITVSLSPKGPPSRSLGLN